MTPEELRAKKAAYMRAYRLRNPEATRGPIRRWAAQNPARHRKARAKWTEANPVARAAHRAVEMAIRRGELVRPKTCSECGSGGRIEAHHADYSKPLEIEWLCRPCHSRRTE